MKHALPFSPRALRWPWLLLPAMILSAGMPQRANANLLINGGFETGDFTGWTATGAGVGISSTSCSAAIPLCTSPVPANSGRFAAVFGGSNSISQTVTLILGHTYLFSYAYNNSFPDARDSLLYSLELGNVVILDGHSGQQLLADAGYAQASRRFVAGTTSVTIRFQDFPCCMGQVNESGSPLYPFALDDVTLEDLGNLSVPEPSGLWMMALGIGGLAIVPRALRKARLERLQERQQIGPVAL